MIGSIRSEVSLLKFIPRLHQALEAWEADATGQLLWTELVHVDATTFRVEGKNHWLHVYSSGGTTLKLLHRKQGNEAIVALNIIPQYGGVIIHDCWASYLSYNHCGHGICGSHLLRELAFVIDSNQDCRVRNLKGLLQEACRIVAKRHDKRPYRPGVCNIVKTLPQYSFSWRQGITRDPLKTEGQA